MEAIQPSTFPSYSYEANGITKYNFVPIGFKLVPIYLATDDPGKNTRGLHIARWHTNTGKYSVLIGLGHNPYHGLSDAPYLRTLAVQYDEPGTKPLGFVLFGSYDPQDLRGVSRSIFQDYVGRNDGDHLKGVFRILAGVFNTLHKTQIISEDNQVSVSGLTELLQSEETKDWIKGLYMEPDAAIEQIASYMDTVHYDCTQDDDPETYDDHDDIILGPGPPGTFPEIIEEDEFCSFEEVLEDSALDDHLQELIPNVDALGSGLPPGSVSVSYLYPLGTSIPTAKGHRVHTMNKYLRYMVYPHPDQDWAIFQGATWFWKPKEGYITFPYRIHPRMVGKYLWNPYRVPRIFLAIRPWKDKLANYYAKLLNLIEVGGLFYWHDQLNK